MGTSAKQRQASKNGKFEFRRLKNKDVRPREYLTDTEVERLMKAAAKTGRHGHRDSTHLARAKKLSSGPTTTGKTVQTFRKLRGNSH